jgi:broad specificity phosphatase PhoE
MRVTFVRHGESAGNASGLIDTSTPGPVLTPLGQQQARDVVGLLGDNNYDAIYASTMVRTQLTAAPMSQYLRLPVKVLPGLQEIEAGVFEGTPEAGASRGYGLYPIGWALPGVIPQIPVDRFNKDTVMPGTNLNGHGFDARVDGALQSMYDNGDRNAVVFSHGGAIMFWTMMNVNNLSATQKLQLLQTAALGNTDYVVIEGNNEDGWTLVDWNGQRFAPEPTLGSEIALQTRTLQRQLAAAANQVAQAFATGDITKILTAITRGVADALFSVSKFHRAVNAKITNEIGKVVSPPAQSEDTPAPHSEVASVMAAPRTTETPDVAPRSGSASRSASDSAEPTSTATDPETTTPAEDVSTDETTATDGDKAATAAATTRPAENRGQYTADDVRDYFSRFTRKHSEAADKSDGTTTDTGTTGTTSDGSSANVNSAGDDSGDDSSDSDSDSDNGGSQRDAA